MTRSIAAILEDTVFQVVVGTNTSVSLISLVEKLGRMDSDLKNFAQKLTEKITTAKVVKSCDKRSANEDHNETKAKFTKEENLAQKAVWETINVDIESFLNKTSTITNQNKHIYLDLMKMATVCGKITKP